MSQQRKWKDDDVLTAKEVAQLLDLHIGTIYRYVQDGLLPATRTGRRRYAILGRDLTAFLAVPVEPRNPQAAAHRRAVEELRRDGFEV